ncbi:hypothetical protein BD410DRAFT_850581 [Rickenella mellea]|uniref:F-box domain-containing protein n=1 Tax=Rickenella mellea TaxID=50990 RepID=A0A4R5XG44_9AGAM|nr:hypothetical protein BD410DRAFT_850581 [Rickenella mellea]
MEAEVDTKTVDDLMDVLSRIKLADGAVYENFIHNPSRWEVQVQASLFRVTEPTVEMVQYAQSEFEIDEDNLRMSTLSRSLRRLRSSCNILRVVYKIAVSKMDDIENTCMPYFLEEGIKSLLDELLRHIFELGYEDEGVRRCSDFSFLVSSVSQRFRRVALDSPRIWRGIHNYMPPAQLELLVSRSKDAGLRIYLTDIWGRNNDDMQFMKIAAPEYIEEAGSIASTWTLPSVRHLDVHNTNFPGAMHWASLSSCELSFIGSSVGHEWDISEVLHGLRDMPSMNSLSLHIDGSIGSRPESGMDMDRLPMPNLRTLTYIFEYCDPELIITPLVDRILIPRLLNLNVEFRGRKGNDEVQLDCLFKGTSPYPSLWTFSLKERQSVLGEFKLDMVQKVVPTLRHVSLDGLCTYISPPKPPHSWESFRIKSHDGHMDDSRITGLAEALMDDPAFQRMDIIQCSRISLQCLRVLKARMGSKLVYEL